MLGNGHFPGGSQGSGNAKSNLRHLQAKVHQRRGEVYGRASQAAAPAGRRPGPQHPKCQCWSEARSALPPSLRQLFYSLEIYGSAVELTCGFTRCNATAIVTPVIKSHFSGINLHIT